MSWRPGSCGVPQLRCFHVVSGRFTMQRKGLVPLLAATLLLATPAAWAGADYPQDSTNPILAPQPIGFGRVYSNYQLLKVPTVLSWQLSDAFSFGLSLNAAYATLTANPAGFAAPDCSGPAGPCFVPSVNDDSAWLRRGCRHPLQAHPDLVAGRLVQHQDQVPGLPVEFRGGQSQSGHLRDGAEDPSPPRHAGADGRGARLDPQRPPGGGPRRQADQL